MSPHHLRHFVAVAEELHFGRAAARLGMQQPPLSQSIRRLEQSMGVNLFVRTSQRVALTPAGHSLLGDARELIFLVDAAARRAIVASEKERREIRIGHLEGFLSHSLPWASSEFSRQWPQVKTSLHRRLSESQVRALHAGELDLGVFSPRNADTTGLSTIVVGRDEHAVAVPCNWPMAKLTQLRLGQLAEQPFIAFSKRLAPSARDAVMFACEATGFTPKVARETSQLRTMLQLVGQGVGVALVPRTISSMGIEGISVLRLVDAPEFLCTHIAIGWVDSTATPALMDLIRVLQRAARLELAIEGPVI